MTFYYSYGYLISDKMRSATKILIAMMVIFSMCGKSNQYLSDGNQEYSSQQPLPGTGNADTVDGYHASNIPQPNTLLALNENAKLPADITGDANTLDGLDSSDFVKKSEVGGGIMSSSLDGYVYAASEYSPHLYVYKSPIQGVTVEIESLSLITTTDSNGYFSFSDVPAGTYFLKINKSGYCAHRRSLTILGNVHAGPFILSPLPSVPSNISVTNEGAGRVSIRGLTTPGVNVVALFSTSSNGPWRCAWGGSYNDGSFVIYLSDLQSGQRYYFQLFSYFYTWYNIYDAPEYVTNPPECVNGYVFQKRCVSERTSLSSFVAP